ncbi:CYFA0S10e01200g1_1 [Cyberlindnera fabianii]|uniref:CYFA0S10e01200g1_1 n=1 Tax=Cyberlindnera fabianii TaxID=36022 RepID=A0A061AYR8_CYBFA|nr:CYFA0S10e01200g1_1 [Cyberlindnera fabianii]
MGYPEPLNPNLRRLNPGVFLASTAFSIRDTLHLGNRMAVMNIPDSKKLIVWSALPMCDAVENALNEAANGKLEEHEVTAAIVPNREHSMAAMSMKERFPNLMLIGPPNIKNSKPVLLDYEFKWEDGDRIMNGTELNPALKGYDFLFLKGHKNNEIVVLDKANKTLFVSDLIMNIPFNGKNQDQYPGIEQNKGLAGYLTQRLNSDSWFGRYIFSNRLFPYTPENSAALKTLMTMDFDTIVLSHGNVIEKDAKEHIKKVYAQHLK